jgi:hypothetical protein
MNCELEAIVGKIPFSRLLLYRPLISFIAAVEFFAVVFGSHWFIQKLGHKFAAAAIRKKPQKVQKILVYKATMGS